MHRRQFIKSVSVLGIGLQFFQAWPAFSETSNSGETVDLAVVSGDLPETLVQTAINLLGGIKRFISRGDIVVIKPNIAWDRRPEQAANTNPQVVHKVAEMCLDAGAKRVKIFDRPVNDPRRCYVQSGIAEIGERLGVDVIYMNKRKFKNIDINGRVVKSWPLYSELFEADKVINIPIAKHHSLAKLTMSIKNWMGIMGGTRSSIHQKLNATLADLSGFIRPTLTILDAIRILTANGPQGGRLEDVKVLNTIIAGTDQVAVDSFGATLFGMEGKDLGYVRIASELGFGTMDLSALNIKRVKV